jgi:hypothetical protein
MEVEGEPETFSFSRPLMSKLAPSLRRLDVWDRQNARLPPPQGVPQFDHADFSAGSQAEREKL